MTVRSVALRCDGDGSLGAGHVARCLPLAEAFAAGGSRPVLVGRYDGLAQWLVARSEIPAEPPRSGPAGLAVGAWDAAVLDSYTLPVDELCAVAAAVPTAFVAEARRCREAGVHLDYHPDRLGQPVDSGAILGPRYTPIDPRFATLRRSRGGPVRRALVTVGGSEAARRIVASAVAALRETFAGVRIVLASGATGEHRAADVELLPYPGALLDVVADVDVAIAAAGLTAAELAAAGVPSVLVAVAPNQQRVISGFAAAGTALVVSAPEQEDELRDAVLRLADPEERRRLAAAGPRLIDGAGAARAVRALESRWGWGPPDG